METAIDLFQSSWLRHRAGEVGNLWKVEIDLSLLHFISIKLVVMQNLILADFFPAFKTLNIFHISVLTLLTTSSECVNIFSLSTFPITFHLHIFQCQLSFNCFCTTSPCYHFLGHFYFPFVPFLRPCFQFQLPLSLFFFNIKLFAWLSAEPAQIRQFIMAWLLLIMMSHYWLCYTVSDESNIKLIKKLFTWLSAAPAHIRETNMTNNRPPELIMG